MVQLPSAEMHSKHFASLHDSGKMILCIHIDYIHLYYSYAESCCHYVLMLSLDCALVIASSKMADHFKIPAVIRRLKKVY